MLLIECNEIKKYYSDRLILDIENLKIYSEDRIGIVGGNGAGKTTLMNILCQRLEPDEGWVKQNGKAAYISQLESPDRKNISREMASKFGVADAWDLNMSGGEKTRFKLAEALEQNSVIVFADEPTSNVDMEGIELLEEKLGKYRGALAIISHDRTFLDELCNKIIEVENGKIKVYKGNYSSYRNQKMKERERAEFEYEAYVKEKKRLKEVVQDTKQKAKNIRKTPRRMGNSEARLHKMGSQRAKANLERAVKSVEKRIEHLEVKEKPAEQSGIKLDIMDSDRLHTKIIIEGKHINKTFGDKIIFKNAEFNIYNGTKTALVGPNGCGKTTMIKMIMDQDAAIKIAHGSKIGYFSQDLDILDKRLSIIGNVMESSIYPESFARLLLSRLLFKGESIYKKVQVISGGERVKVSLVKVLLQNINMLILDEPTNYMDINALEVIEEALKNYDRTLLFVSHDRQFVDAVSDHIMVIEDKKIKKYTGNYTEYLSRKNRTKNFPEEENRESIMILENRLSDVIGRLSMLPQGDNREALDREYHEIIDKIKDIKGFL